MPLPTPKDGQSKDVFLAACMSNAVMVAEFPSEPQRYAVCLLQWQDREAPTDARQDKWPPLSPFVR